jgi:hypothetical protein
LNDRKTAAASKALRVSLGTPSSRRSASSATALEPIGSGLGPLYLTRNRTAVVAAIGSPRAKRTISSTCASLAGGSRIVSR